MYRRLWWKDARQFWPIWVFLLAVGAAAHLLVHHYADPQNRGWILGLLAVGWPALYAFAVGAAAFAGERENGTLALLDALPASRRAVWAGKVSFAVASTFALSLVLLAAAWLDSSPGAGRGWGSEESVVVGVVLLLCLAWALFCSSILPSALLAAVVAILLASLSPVITPDAIMSDRLAIQAWSLGLALAMLAGSFVTFGWGRRRRLSLGIELRSPVVVTYAGAGAGRSRAAVAAVAGSAAPATIAAPVPGRALTPAIRTANRPRPRSRLAELRSLMWQTMREGRSIGWVLLTIGLICSARILVEHIDLHQFTMTPLPLLGYETIVLVAGVSVFGLENRRQTQRWLVHHGARPGLVWLAKLVPWFFGLALIMSPLAYLALRGLIGLAAFEEVMILAVGMPLGFAVAVLCGMAIPRTITAVVVAMVIALVGGGGAVGLARAGLVPIWGPLILPVALLVVTWAWSGDWLLDRPAPGRWVRLGLMLAAALGTTFAGYAGYRAWSVPDVGPIPRPGIWAAGLISATDDRNAAGLYREATDRLNLVVLRPPYIVTVSPDPPDLDRHPEAFDLIRRAAARPECRFYDPDKVTLLSQLDLPPMGPLADAVAEHARRRLDGGDLAAAWDDVMILFRIARHEGQGATIGQGAEALAIETRVLSLAREWAGAPGQTPDRLRAAISAYRDLPPMTPAADVIRAEGILVERSINLPIDDLRDWIVDSGTQTQPRRTPSTWELLRLDLAATPWERARARRLNRLFTAEAADLAELEPWQRGAAAPRRATAELLQSLRDEPIAFSLLALFQPSFPGYQRSYDANEAERRATLLVLAVRAWQLRHDGSFPAVLEALVPEELPGLPLDPFTGRRFGYTTFHPSGDRPASRPRIDWPPETRLIFSAGPDGEYNGGTPPAPNNGAPGDMVFPIPPHPAKARENRGQPGPTGPRA